MCSAARAEGATSFESAGSCVHLGVSLFVDAAAASAVLPDGFVPIEPTPGTAGVALVTQDCTASIDGGSPSQAINSVVFVSVDPLRSPAGCQSYDLFWPNSKNDDWQRAMTGIGINSDLSPRASLRVHSSGAGLLAHADNPYARASFSYGGNVADAIAGPAPLQSVHCHLGSRGFVRSTYDHEFWAGLGSVDVTLGRSRLWEHFGATDTTTNALFARFTWTGMTEIVG